MFFLLLIIIAPIVIYEIYNSRTHIKCKPEQLREDAKVISVDTKSVGLKQTMRYRTTVVFSDGFEYISHMTNRKDGVFHYTISLTTQMKNEIVTEAKIVHLQRLRKYQNKNGISIINSVEKEFIETPKLTAKTKTNSEVTCWMCPICNRKNLSSSNRCWNCANIKK